MEAARLLAATLNDIFGMSEATALGRPFRPKTLPGRFGLEVSGDHVDYAHKEGTDNGGGG